jgi:hypothetical protein
MELAYRQSSETFDTLAFGRWLDWHEPVCQKIKIDTVTTQRIVGKGAVSNHGAFFYSLRYTKILACP